MASATLLEAEFPFLALSLEATGVGATGATGIATCAEGVPEVPRAERFAVELAGVSDVGAGDAAGVDAGAGSAGVGAEDAVDEDGFAEALLDAVVDLLWLLLVEVLAVEVDLPGVDFAVDDFAGVSGVLAGGGAGVGESGTVAGAGIGPGSTTT